MKLKILLSSLILMNFGSAYSAQTGKNVTEVNRQELEKQFEYAKQLRAKALAAKNTYERYLLLNEADEILMKLIADTSFPSQGK